MTAPTVKALEIALRFARLPLPLTLDERSDWMIHQGRAIGACETALALGSPGVGGGERMDECSECSPDTGAASSQGSASRSPSSPSSPPSGPADADGFTYQWLVCDENGSDCEIIEGATSRNLPNNIGAVPGKTYRCVVTAKAGE